MAYDREAQRKYQKTGKRVFTLNLSIRTKAEVIARLDAQPSVSGYLCRLVEEDIEREGKIDK